jgi:hypothetical protein
MKYLYTILFAMITFAINSKADDAYYQYDKHWPDGTRMGIPTYEHHPGYDVFRELDANGNITYEHVERHPIATVPKSTYQEAIDALNH